MDRLLGKLSAVIGSPLPARVERRLRGLRLWMQLLALMMLNDLTWAWLTARVDSLGLVLAPDVRLWIGWTSAAICLPLVLWEMIYDSRNPRRDGGKAPLPTDPDHQSTLLFWLGLCALIGVCASLFFALALPACVAIGGVLAVPGFFPTIRERVLDALFGKRAASPDRPGNAG